MSNDQQNPEQNSERFLELFVLHQEDLKRYIISIHPHRNEIDDLLQNTALALMRKFDSYDPTLPFLNWAFRFAYYEVLKHREKFAKRMQLCRSTLELLAEESQEDKSFAQARKRALERCLETIKPEWKLLLELRYEKKMKIVDIAKELGQPIKKCYKTFETMRNQLNKCSMQRLTEEGWAN